MNDIWDLDSI